MPIETLLASLERRVAEREAAIDAEAAATAAALAAEADRAVQAERAAFQRERGAVLRAEADRAIVAARREATRATLAAREALLDRVFAAAAARVADLALGAEYLRSLPERIAAARAFAGEREAVITCAPPLVDRVRALADGTRVVAGGPGTGFVLDTADGSLTVDDTLERALARRRASLAARVLERFDELVPWDETSET